jgi:diadenosine tetraphosphatase ApaH/serine/threonine PP2A family protein phosphatase
MGLGFLLRCFSNIEVDDEERHLGWIGWIYSPIYSRISQTSWVAGNFHSASAELKDVFRHRHQYVVINEWWDQMEIFHRSGLQCHHGHQPPHSRCFTLGAIHIRLHRQYSSQRCCRFFDLLPITSVMEAVVRFIVWSGPVNL